MPTPPRPTARPAAVSSGSSGLALARLSRDTSRATPTASRTITAGTLSDSVSASWIVTVPRLKPVEIDRHIAVERRGPILDQRLRMGEAELEGEPVDQRLQRRARRAHRRRHVDEAAIVGVEVAGRADRGEDVAGR